MSKIKNTFYSNQRDNFLFNKVVEMVAIGLVDPLSLSNEYIKRIISNPELLKKKSYNGHNIGYLFAISESEDIQRRLIEDLKIRKFKVTNDGRSIAHLVAENPASERIRLIILSDRELNSIKDDNGRTVLSMLRAVSLYEVDTKKLLRIERNE